MLRKDTLDTFWGNFAKFSPEVQEGLRWQAVRLFGAPLEAAVSVCDAAVFTSHFGVRLVKGSFLYSLFYDSYSQQKCASSRTAVKNAIRGARVFLQ